MYQLTSTHNQKKSKLSQSISLACDPDTNGIGASYLNGRATRLRALSRQVRPLNALKREPISSLMFK